MDLPVECAPNVAPDTLEQIAHVESRGNPLAIHVNDAGGVEYPTPKTLEEAAAIAARLIAEGHSVDMGLMQINSNNLDWLGMTPAEVYDPCLNVAAGGRVLTEAYQRAAVEFGPGQRALQAALSAYNTGSFTAGFENGYVERYGLEASVSSLDKLAAEAGTSIKLGGAEDAPDWFSQVAIEGQDESQEAVAAATQGQPPAADPYTADTSVALEYASASRGGEGGTVTPPEG